MQLERLRLTAGCLALLLSACGSAGPDPGETLDTTEAPAIIDAQAGPWLARHGLTAAQYQAEFDRWVPQGYRPTYASAYATSGGTRFNVIFDRDPGGAWEARHGLTAAQYQAEFDRWVARGYRPRLVNGYTENGEERYLAIFEVRSGPAWQARHGMTGADYQRNVEQFQREGYRPVHVSGYLRSGELRYAAIWEASSGVAWEARHGLSASDYQAEFDRQLANGYRLVHVNAYGPFGAERYAAIWERSSGAPWVARHGVDASAYQGAFDDLRLQGYRPVLISAAEGGRFAAIFQNLAFSAADLATIDRIVEGVRASASVPGISIAIARDGRLVFAKGYGLADRDLGTPVTTGSRFRIASVSKPITSAAIMRLVEQGRLSLDARVFGSGGILGTTYGTQPYGLWIADITVRNLLQHTGGGWTNDGNDPMFSNPSLDRGQLISWVLNNRPLDAQPGTQYAYSNFGYCVLGRVIEAVTGMNYDEFVRREVLAPSGVTGMEIGGDTRAEARPGEVTYYDGFDPYSMEVARMDAHGGWISTATDLVRFGVRFDGFATKPDLISASTFQTMTTGSAPNPNYALGWARNSVPNFWHDGSLPGTRSILVRTNGGFVWSALANSRTPEPDLDSMMWNVVNSVSAFPGHDLF